MKQINPVGRTTKMDTQAFYGMDPMAGCICSGTVVLSFFAAKFDGGNCNCQCSGGTKNSSANSAVARKA